MLIVTTTVDVRRPSGTGDPYEAPAGAPLVASAVAAHISAPNGAERNVGGAGERIDADVFLPAGTDLRAADRLTDRTTGAEYRVATVVARIGLGLDHVRATLVAVAGGANA